MRRSLNPFCAPLLLLLLLPGCAEEPELTEQRAREIVERSSFRVEPVYAEVPQRVWWNSDAPRDEYDGRALETLRNLERAGMVTLSGSGDDLRGEWKAVVTQKGSRLLGTAPSQRGPVFRAKICEKRYVAVRNFIRHPGDASKANADLVWRYDAPTPLFPMFTTRIDKELGREYVTRLSFWYESGRWHVDVLVRKERL